MEKNTAARSDENISILAIGNTYKYRVHIENWSHTPPPTDCSQMGYVLEGEAYFNINGKTYEIKQGDIFYTDRGTNFYSWGKKGFFEYISIHFTTPADLAPDVIPHCIHVSDNDYIENLFRKIRYEYIAKTPAFTLRIKSMLYKILAYIVTSDMDSSAGSKHSVIAQSLLYMENNLYSKDLDIATIAEQSNISATHFRKIFKEIYGITPLKYITDKRLEKATELLYYENFSINRIADFVGYRYTVYFTKLFKEKYGVSPRKYKRNNY